MKMSISDKDELYDYDYSSNDYFRQPHDESADPQSVTWMSLTRVILVILLRVGFVLIQTGSVPINNVNLILLQNLVDVCWVTTVYFLIGYMVAYNGDVGGLIAEGYWIGHPKVDKDEAIIGWAAVAIASAISTCGIVGRTHTVGYLTVGFLLSALVQPFVIHWAWTSTGWMKRNSLGGKDVTFRDYAGSGVVHLVGGLTGLIGCIALGRRILRLKDIDEASIATGSSGTVFAGQLLVYLGVQSLSLMNCQIEKPRIIGKSLSRVYVNNLLAGSSCCLLVIALHFIASREAFNHWTVMRCVQGTVSGLVVISAGTNVYSAQAAIGLGCIGGIIFYLVSKQVFHSALEDYCNIIAAHFVCAILGILVAPLCDITEETGIVSVLLNFSWQLICLFVLLALVTIVMTITFATLQFFDILRNRTEALNHSRANVAIENGPARSYMQRLFMSDNESVYLQPTGLGNRLQKYRKEIDEAEQSRSIGNARI